MKRGPTDDDLRSTQTDLDCQMAVEHTQGAKRHDRANVSRPGKNQ